MDPAQAQMLQMMMMAQQQQKASKPESEMSWAEYLHFKTTVTLPKVSQKVLYYGWIPLICYVGLNLGTHKYFDEANPMAQKERPASITDCIPIFGTAGGP